MNLQSRALTPLNDSNIGTGAILQCADGISSSLTDVIDVSNLNAEIVASIKESISNAETIQLCAQHQKSIVDECV